MARIRAVCTSAEKGQRKKDVGTVLLLKNLGIEGDAHAGFMHRQVSLLAEESIQKMRDKALNVGHGDFGENIVTAGIELMTLPIGTRLKAGRDVFLRVTQIGKKCHDHCAIYELAGDCVMPREGIFCEVLKGGSLSTDEEIAVYPDYRFAVITASDKGARQLREDKSGPLLEEMLLPWGDVRDYHMVPDEIEVLSELMGRLADEKKADIILTTGGTGLGPRDVTPEATRRVIEREVPGIAEAMRMASLAITDRAMLSRGLAGIRGRTLIINLPGSPKAAAENLAVFLPVLEHALEILSGRGGECARN